MKLKEIADKIISASGVPFTDIIVEADNVYMTIPFGEPSHENEISVSIREDTLEVGVYDQFDEISILRTSHDKIDIIIAIVKHIYDTNNYI